MSLRTEKPTKGYGRMTPSRQMSLAASVSQAWARATRRYKIAKLVASVPGSLETKRLAVVRAMENDAIPPGAIPSKSTVSYLERMWQEGFRSIENYQEGDGRTGRPLKHIPDVFQEEIDRVVGSGLGRTPHALLVDFQEQAQSQPGIEAPTYYLIRKEFAKAGRMKRAAARHGSRGGIVDGGPKGRFVAEHSHDIWALDELTLPVWVGMYSNALERWISARCDMVLIIDLCSRYPVGWYIADPSRRTDEHGREREGGFDSRDVLAALLSAACPDLAPDSTKAGAGYLCRILRWDNHQAHKTVAALLADMGIEIKVRRIPKRQAFNNGAAERPNRVVKPWFAGVVGHVDEYLPTDRLTKEMVDPGHARTVAAGTTPDRETRKIEIAPEQLMRIDELRELADRIMRRFGHVLVRSKFKQTAFNRLQERLARGTPRRGYDLVRALPPVTTTVQDGWIRHYADGREYQYQAVIDNSLWMDDKPVTYIADPVNRGIFVLDNSRLHFLEHDPAPEESRARAIARTRRNAARHFSDYAKQERDSDFIAEMGARALADAKNAMEVERQALAATENGEPVPPPMVLDDTPPPGRKRTAKGKGKNTQKAEPQPSVEPATDDPWATDDPSAFVRPKGPTSNGASDDAV